MSSPSLSDMFSAGRDLNLDAGDTASGGQASFGNITGPNVGGRRSDWMMSSVTGSQVPKVIGIGLASLLAVGVVYLIVRGRK